MKTIDRIDFATKLARGARVLDIGGQKMESCDPNSPFAVQYAGIEKAAKEYLIVDYQRQPTVDFVIDFNKAESIGDVRKAIDGVKPEVILCMETLEHINYHYELMNEMARSVELYNSVVFITIPNNGNWVFNALGWNHDHSTAFFRDIAHRFVTRSDLGKHNVLLAPCMQKYLWYWRAVYLLSLCQPFSWGFWVTPQAYRPSAELTPVFEALSARTAALYPPRAAAR